jgi:hypothetical protein
MTQRGRQRTHRLYCAAGAAVAGLLLVAAVGRHASAGQERAAHGYVVQLDTDGRPIVPTPGDESVVAEPAQGTAAETAPPQVQPAPGGGEMIILDGRFRNDSVGHRTDGGRVSIECTRPDRAKGVTR